MFKKSYLFLTLLTAFLWLGSGTMWGDELVIANGTGTSQTYPVYGSWADNYVRSQMIYPATMLSSIEGKKIDGMTFHIKTVASEAWTSTFQVRLANVPSGTNYATSTAWNTTEGTLVYEGTLDGRQSTMSITFSSPFTYEGGALLVEVKNTTLGNYPAPYFYGASQSSYTAVYGRNSSSMTFNPSSRTKFLPKVTIEYSDAAPITCPKPSALTQGAVTHNSAAFTWTAGGEEPSWQYVYLPAATALTDEAWEGATAGTVSSTAAVTLNGLSAATDYKLYVRAACSATDQSAHIYKQFRTNNVMPFSEDFTGLTSGIPTAWDNTEGTTSTASYRWNYNNSGHDAAPCVRFNSSANTSGNTNILKTPAIYIDKAAALSFWYKNPTGGDFSVYYSIDGVKQTDALATDLTGAADWMNYEVVLPTACVGHNVKILFQGTSNWGSSTAYIYLDDVVIEAASSCAKPTALSAYALTYNQASVSWTAGGEETSWNLQYSTDNFDTFTSVNGISENPYTLEGLTANTTYKVRIQADCGGAQSGWVVSSAFTTPCEPVNGIGWSEDFEEATAGSGKMPDCWQKNTNNTSYPNVNSSSYYQKEGSSKCLYFYGGTSTSVQIAILPPFNEATNTLYVTLDYSQAYEYYSYTYDYSTSDYGQLAIGYMTNPADASSFTAAETLPRVNTYTSASVALTGAPAGSYVAIRYAGGDVSGNVFVDNISISAIPSCVAPSGVNGSATAYNQASISWTANSGESAWKLQYSSDNGATWSAEIDANANPFVLTGLDGNNDYIVQVKAVCGGEDVSAWSASSAPIHTPCGPVDASDYNETMENSAVNIGHLPDCWQYREKYSSGYPYVYSYAYYAYAGSNSLYFYGGVDGSSEQSVLLPDMNQPLNSLTFEFYYKASESTMYIYPKFTVGYIAADGTTFVPIETLNYADSYTKYTKDLAALPANAKCLAIRYAGGESYAASGYIDNVRVYPTPNCLEPTGVTVSNVTATTADVAWTENNSATAWKIQLSNDGSTWGDAIDVNTNPYQLTGLTPNHATYYVRVKAICGVGDESPYSAASDMFETECAAEGLPFSEDFSAANPCWTKQNCYSSTGLYSGTFRFYYNYASTEIPPQYLISPEINTDSKEVTVEFDYYAESGSWPETFHVGYSTTTKEVAAFTWGAEVTSTNTSAQKYSENLPVGVKYVAIKHTSDGQYYLYIDNFSVTEYVAPACPAVSAATLQESAVTAHTATVSWTAGGEETAWNLQYKAAGGEWSDVIAISTTPSYDLTGLAEHTLYYVRVQANCGEDLSEWTGDDAFSFPTDCEPKAVTKAQPWEYSFEDTEAAEFPACWDRKEIYANHGYPRVAESSYGANTGTKYLYFYSPNSTSATYTQDAILPTFNTEIKNLKVSFAYYSSTNSKAGQLAIGYVSGNEFTQVGELLAKVDDYTSIEREMPNDAPDGARIAIRCIGSTANYSTTGYVDDIVVSLKPTCYTPTALAAAETSDGAVLTWTAGKDENEWNVRYSVKDADSWTIVPSIADETYTLTGLSLDVTYEVQVRAYCGENDESEWSASVEFTPVCNAPSALAVTARTMTSATFSWTSSESAWVLQYSVDGENWESENVNANPYTLNGLTAGQTYQAKIQAACGSDFSNVVEFTTVCAMRSAAELPFSEDFTGIADDALPACWESDSAHVESEKLFFRGADEQIVVLPGYDVALNKLSVSFDYTLNNASMQFGYVETIDGEFHSLAELEGTAFEADLTTAPAFAGYLAFRYYNSLSQYAANTIDNIVVMDKSALALKDTEDNDAVLAELEGETVTITINRTIFCDGYFNTLCLPFDLDAAALAASPLAGYARLAKFTEATVESGSDELQLVYEYATSIEAGVPYLINFPAGENIVNPTFTNVVISATAGSSANLGNGIIVKGILKPEPFTAGNEEMLFLLGENKLSWAGITNYLKGFRAYFQLTDVPAGSPVRRGMNARIVERQNTPTGIDNAKFNDETIKRLENNQVIIIRNGVKYNIQGQVISE